MSREIETEVLTYSERIIKKKQKMVENMRVLNGIDLKRKTRRGKKRRPQEKCLAGYNSPEQEKILSGKNVFSTTYDHLSCHPYLSGSTLSRKGCRKRVRPTSPNAPQNSTQFLIADRDCYYIAEHFNSLSPESGCHQDAVYSPFQTMNTEDLPFRDENVSFYNELDNQKTNETPLDQAEDYYSAFDDKETYNFIQSEFEKEYLLQEEQSKETYITSRHKELMSETKATIALKIIQIEAALLELDTLINVSKK